MLSWILDNSKWIFSGIGVAIFVGIITWIRHRKMQSNGNISAANTIEGSSNINAQAGGNVTISVASPNTKDTSLSALNADAPTGRSVSINNAVGENILCISVNALHTGRSCKIDISPKESILMLIEKARIGLGFGYEAKIAGTPFPFLLRWTLVDERAVVEWKNLSVYQQQRTYALIKPLDECIFVTSSTQSVMNAGVYNGMEARLFPIQEDDSPSKDQGMLASVR